MPRLCGHENCRKRASYALTYCNPDRCKEHRGDRKPQYKVCKCGKAQPTYNEPGETRPICCSECKNDTMVDVVNKKCKANNETLCDRRGNRKYKGYCSRCFQYKFPTDPLTFQIRSKTKEIAVKDFINANFDGWCHDKLMYSRHCERTIRRRLDHRVLIKDTQLVVETDEHQHKSYDKMDEEIRYDDLFMAYSGKWIFIRFNPDKYKSKTGKNKNPAISTRLIALKKEIEKQIKRIHDEENIECIEKIYMYYDNYN